MESNSKMGSIQQPIGFLIISTKVVDTLELTLLNLLKMNWLKSYEKTTFINGNSYRSAIWYHHQLQIWIIHALNINFAD